MSLTKIEKLTPLQDQQMAEFREEIRARSLSCEPANREATKNVLVSFYNRIGKKAPTVWMCDSPLQAQIWIHLFKNGLGDNLMDNLRANLWDNLMANLRANLMANLGDNLMANLRANLGDNLAANLWANLWDNLRDNAKIEFVQTWMWGSMDAYWVTFYRFPHEYLRPVYDEKDYSLLMEWDALAASCGWWWPYENIVFIADRPREIHFDDSWRLHNTSGPAIRYSDGYALYSVHGVAVNKKIISRDFTAADITAEDNTEARRVMLDLYGTPAYIKEIGATPIHKDKTGILYRIEQPGDEPICMTRVLNSTPEPDGTLSRDEAREIFGEAAYATDGHGPETRWKEYWEGVPPDMQTCAQAVAWGFGMTESEYAPALET